MHGHQPPQLFHTTGKAIFPDPFTLSRQLFHSFSHFSPQAPNTSFLHATSVQIAFFLLTADRPHAQQKGTCKPPPHLLLWSQCPSALPSSLTQYFVGKTSSHDTCFSLAFFLGTLPHNSPSLGFIFSSPLDHSITIKTCHSVPILL